jgi:ParB family chromosome partitioning protein
LDAILGDAMPASPPQTIVSSALERSTMAREDGEAGVPLEVPVEKISPGRAQPRRHFDEQALDELAASIVEKGIIQPLIVTQTPNGYELIAGERRLRAAIRAGLETVPVVVKKGIEAGELIELALIENIQREDLSPLEEAKAYQHMLADHGRTQEEVARRVGKARTTIANSIRLLALPESLKQAINDGKLSEGHARALLGLPTTAAQVAAARTVMQRGLSVRETEQLVRGLADRKKASSPGSEVAVHARTTVEKTLERVLGTKVRIRGRGKGGRIEIDYFSHDELDRLLDRLGA